MPDQPYWILTLLVFENAFKIILTLINKQIENSKAP